MELTADYSSDARAATGPDVQALTVLGLETSCDETAASVVRLHPSALGGRAEVLSSVVHSQIDDHAAYGGVVPEIAARSHVEMIDGVTRRAMAEAGLDFGALDGVAATAGPGLVGGVMVGLSYGKAVSLARGLPLVAVNHLEGHAVSARLGAEVAYPFLLLLVSGGHCQILEVRGIGDMSRIGATIDDAAGEAFDKIAKALGLGYPGGPELSRLAQDGDPGAYALPRPMMHSGDLDFSFSGLKTAVLTRMRALQDEGDATGHKARADLAASTEAAIVDVLASKSLQALRRTGLKTLVVAGGVGANRHLRARLTQALDDLGGRAYFPPLQLCTDNGAMIAWAAVQRARAGLIDLQALRGDAAFAVRPRWDLSDVCVA